MALARELYPHMGTAKVAIEAMKSVALVCKANPEQIQKDRQGLYEYLTKVTNIIQVLVVDQAPEGAKETAFYSTTFEPYMVHKLVEKGPYSGLLKGWILHIVPKSA